MTSDIVKQAVASGRYHREVFVGAPEGGIILEGFIDLVFETDEGLVIVDYKTDGLNTAEEISRSMDKFKLQGGSYALALERLTGRSVVKIVFLFLYSGAEVVMENLPGAMSAVRKEVLRLATVAK